MKNPTQRRRNGFTLIELMAVITIIVILAGIVVGSMGYVNERQANEKAKVQIALLSKALEEYKLDNGFYPPTANKSGDFVTQKGTDTSSILFDYLYWDTDRDGVGGSNDKDQKVYLPELDPENNKQGWTSGGASASTKILDPWNNEYCYRSAIGAAKGGSPPSPNNATQNPEFDLWSMGKNGKTRRSPSHKENADDIRNF